MKISYSLLRYSIIVWALLVVLGQLIFNKNIPFASLGGISTFVGMIVLLVGLILDKTSSTNCTLSQYFWKNLSIVVAGLILYLQIAFLSNATTSTLGNLDFWAYWKHSSIFLDGISVNNIKDFDITATRGFNQALGVYSSIAWIRALTGLEGIAAIQLFTTAIVIVSACLIYSIGRHVIFLSNRIALLVAFGWLFGGVNFYLIGNYFLAQQAGIFLMLYMIVESFSPAKSNAEKVFKAISCGSALILVLYSYQIMLFPILMLHIYGILFFFKNRSKIKQILFHSIGMTLVFTALFFINIDSATQLFLEIFRLVGEVANGWPLDFVTPLALMVIWPYSENFTVPFKYGLPIYALLLIYIGWVVRSWRMNTKLALVSRRRLWFGVLSATLIAAYIGLYAVKGASYQQWKYWTTFILPLIPILVIGSVFQMPEKKYTIFEFRITKEILEIIFICSIIFAIITNIASVKRHEKDFLKLNELYGIVNQPNYNAIDQDLTVLMGDFQTTMAAAAIFNGPLKLRLISQSYYSRGDPFAVLDGMPNDLNFALFLTDIGCDDPNVHVIARSGRYCVSEGLGRYVMLMASPDRSYVSSSGLSGPEAFGRWSDGDKVLWRFVVSPNWNGTNVKFKIDPIKTSESDCRKYGIVVNNRKQELRSSCQREEILVEVPKSDCKNIVCTIQFDLPDAIVPKEHFGGTDSRKLSLAFHSIEVGPK